MRAFGVNKYKAKKIVDQEFGKFDSKAEYSRWLELVAMERAGMIADLRRQVRYEVIPANDKNRKTEYIADAVYTENGRVIVEDTKGFETPEYIIKKKLMYHVHGIEIFESRMRPKKSKRKKKS